MRATIIALLIMSLFSFTWIDNYGVSHKVDLRAIFTIAALLCFTNYAFN